MPVLLEERLSSFDEQISPTNGVNKMLRGDQDEVKNIDTFDFDPILCRGDFDYDTDGRAIILKND